MNQRTSTGPLLAVAMRRDGKTIAASFGFGIARPSRAKPGIQLWDIDTGEPHQSQLYEGDDLPHALAFTPDGAVLVAAFDDKVARAYRLDTYKEEAVLQGHTAAVLGLALSHDGDVLATAGGDAKVCVWRCKNE